MVGTQRVPDPCDRPVRASYKTHGFKTYRGEWALQTKAKNFGFEKNVDTAYHTHCGDSSGIPMLNSQILSQLLINLRERMDK